MLRDIEGNLGVLISNWMLLIVRLDHSVSIVQLDGTKNTDNYRLEDDKIVLVSGEDSLFGAWTEPYIRDLLNHEGSWELVEDLYGYF